MDKIMGPLQKLGKALMGAVAVLPVAALMMGVGYFLENKGGEGLSWLADIFQASGGAVLDTLASSSPSPSRSVWPKTATARPRCPVSSAFPP